jgi:hypothetical protein
MLCIIHLKNGTRRKLSIVELNGAAVSQFIFIEALFLFCMEGTGKAYQVYMK